MRIQEALQIPKGITSVIGSGGKTTLLHRLAEELTGQVILCTTTRMFPFPDYPTLYDPTPEQLRAEPLRPKQLSPEPLRPNSSRVICVGSRAENGKLGPCASMSMQQLAETADYVLVEADGSRGLPLKAHAPWEPVIAQGTARVICVVGASGFGRPVEQCVHRPQLWRMPDTSPASVAGMLLLEGGWDAVLVNQCDRPKQMEQALLLADRLQGRPVYAGSLKKGELQRLS